MVAMGSSRFLLLFLLLCVTGSYAASPMLPSARLCVDYSVDCTNLQSASNSMLSCTQTRDRIDCLKKMRDGEAEFGYFEAEDLNLASVFFSDMFQAAIEISTTEKEPKRAFMLVYNASDPKPKTLCHPGFNLERLFPPALYRPPTFTSKVMLMDIQSHIQALAQEWTQACIPGRWSQDPVTDNKLKQKYNQLCSLCPDQSCSGATHYAGAGALQCLLEHKADAAIVSDVDLQKERVRNHEVDNLSLLCRSGGGNGKIQPLRSAFAPGADPCDWGQRPAPVLLTTVCHNSECENRRHMRVTSITLNPDAVTEVLQLPSSTTYQTVPIPLTPSRIIKNSGYKLDNTLRKNPVRFCVTSEEELAKCHDLQKAAMAYGVGANVGIGCVLDTTDEHCFPDIYLGGADVIALDGGDVYKVGQDFGFERLLSEVYNSTSGTSTSSYYAVAVVRAESNITYFSHLRGRKSCHTGIGKTSGWKMPIATLLEQRLIEPLHCNYVNAIAEFFTGGSCAPGAKSTKYNPNGNYVDSLCRLCRGGTDTHCARGSSEPFYSYDGAFRCLVQGGGDVAFVKHTTVPDNTDGHSEATWTKGLYSEQFKLLCPNGDRAAVTDYQNCNLAMVPAHEVVVSGRMREPRKDQVRDVLLAISKAFNSNAPGSKTFKLFGKYHGRPDLLFKDSAVGLRSLSEDTPVEIRRKKEYFKKLNELHTCEIRVCALEDELEDCEAMAADMLEEGQRFVCVSARDRYDCMQRVMKQQVDMSPLPGRYLGQDQLRMFAVMRDPAITTQRYRYKAVVVVRRSTVSRLSDLRGKKSCHTGYGRTTGWRIPVALLKREGLISPACDPHQSSLEHEIASVARTFNRACVPGAWATSTNVDQALKNKYKAMCSLCRSSTCDKDDEYSGYVGALKCLTENGGDVAFSKLKVAQEFFTDNRAVDIKKYGLLCRDNRVVPINSPEAEDCYWAARPWDAYVTSSTTSNNKVQKLFWALTQARRKGEENLAGRKWYYTTLGLNSDFMDIYSENMTSQEYYRETHMDVVEAEEMCQEEPVSFCVVHADEYIKCRDLVNVLNLLGVSPPLTCVMEDSVDECIDRISIGKADLVTLTDTQRITHPMFLSRYNLESLVTENYGKAKNRLYYLLAVVRKSSGITSPKELAGKTSCQKTGNTTVPVVIDDLLKDCMSAENDFFTSFRDAFVCLTAGNKDVAFLKYSALEAADIENTDQAEILNSENFQMLCHNGTVAPVHEDNFKDCNMGYVPADVVVTRRNETGARKENMRHLLLTASQNFGKRDSYFRLFYKYFNSKDLLFKDRTTDLSVTSVGGQQDFMDLVPMDCNLYTHHIQDS